MEGIAEKYLNVPVALLNGLLANPQKTVENILIYCIHVAVDVDKIYSTRHDMMEVLEIDDQHFEYDVIEKFLKSGSYLYRTKLKRKRSPYVGIRVDALIWMYCHTDKNRDFEMVVVLAYLALKSIIQQQIYKNIQVDYWFSRMDGHSGKMPWDEISPEIKEWSTRRKRERIIRELEESFGMIRPCSKTRGMTFSFKSQKMSNGTYMTEEKLEMIVQEKRKAFKDRINKERKKAIQQKVKYKLEGRIQI